MRSIALIAFIALIAAAPTRADAQAVASNHGRGPGCCAPNDLVCLMKLAETPRRLPVGIRPSQSTPALVTAYRVLATHVVAWLRS